MTLSVGVSVVERMEKGYAQVFEVAAPSKLPEYGACSLSLKLLPHIPDRDFPVTLQKEGTPYKHQRLDARLLPPWRTEEGPHKAL